MCFSIIVGKKASATGAVLMAANDDWPGCPGRVLHTPPMHHMPEESFLTVKEASIPQVPETFGYTYSAAAYETGTRPVSWADGVNDRQVAVSMQGVYAFHNCQTEKDLLEADDLVILMLERGKTAREAINLAGELISEYGFTVSSIEGAEGTVCMAVADPEEGFFLELGPGGYWAARRVEDDRAECRPNCFGIGVIDFKDTERFLCSPGLEDLAMARGHKAGEPLNFAKCFGGDVAQLNEKYGGALNPVNTLRKWAVINRLSGLDLPLDTQTYDCVPAEPVTVESLMELMRDSLCGTQYDLAVAPEAGPHQNPFWMEISTSIAQGGTVVCMLVEFSRRIPTELGGIAWFAYGNVRLSPFVPCYTGGRGLPEAYQIGECGDFNLGAAWWAFEDVAEVCYRNYETIAAREVIPIYTALERAFRDGISALEQEVLSRCGLDISAAQAQLQRQTDDYAVKVLETAVTLGRRLKGKYLCNTVLSWL